MGNCCKQKDIKELEDELGLLMNEKRALEEKLIEHERSLSTDSASTVPEIYKFIDYDQYASLKIIETLNTLVPADKEVLQSLSQKIHNLSHLKEEQKLARYSELRKEETDLQKKLVTSINENFKLILELKKHKISDIESRIDRVESLLMYSKTFLSERGLIKQKIKEIQLNPNQDLNHVVQDLEKIRSIEKHLFDIEKSLPGLNGDAYQNSLKNIENLISALSKNSLSLAHSFEQVLGEVKLPENIDVTMLKLVNIDKTTFSFLFESIEKHLNALLDLETAKISIIENNSINAKLKSIDKTLTKHFEKSEQTKETACSRLNRVSRTQSDFTVAAQLQFLDYEFSEKSIPATISVLKDKAKRYLKSLESQDKMILEMTEKLNQVDKIIDELELKFQEYIVLEVKELSKWISQADQSIKNMYSDLSNKIIEYEERPSTDLLARLENFQSKFIQTDTLNIIKSHLKENVSKELSRAKTEQHDQINDLNSKLSEALNAKNLSEASLKSIKSQLEKRSQMSEDLLTESNEKDLQISTLKSKVSSLETNLEEISQEKNQVKDELEDIQKELKDCKRNLRSKEHELSELKESLSSQS